MFASTRFATAASGPNLPRGCGLRHRPVVYVVLASIMRRVVCGQRTTVNRPTANNHRTPNHRGPHAAHKRHPHIPRRSLPVP
jgi:hypothetical protein